MPHFMHILVSEDADKVGNPALHDAGFALVHTPRHQDVGTDRRRILVQTIVRQRRSRDWLGGEGWTCTDRNEPSVSGRAWAPRHR